MWSEYWRIAGVKRYSGDGSASKHHAWIREPRHCIRSACRQDVLTCDMLASCYESCWAATRYGVEHSHGVGRQTTSIRQWNVSTCLDGWIGYRVCCPVACLAVCRCTGAFLTDASLAWHGLGRCANTITLRGRVDRVVSPPQTPPMSPPPSPPQAGTPFGMVVST